MQREGSRRKSMAEWCPLPIADGYFVGRFLRQRVDTISVDRNAEDRCGSVGALTRPVQGRSVRDVHR